MEVTIDLPDTTKMPLGKRYTLEFLPKKESPKSSGEDYFDTLFSFGRSYKQQNIPGIYKEVEGVKHLIKEFTKEDIEAATITPYILEQILLQMVENAKREQAKKFRALGELEVGV